MVYIVSRLNQQIQKAIHVRCLPEFISSRRVIQTRVEAKRDKTRNLRGGLTLSIPLISRILLFSRIVGCLLAAVFLASKRGDFSSR